MKNEKGKILIENRLGGVNGIVFSVYLYIVISLNWNYMHSPIGIFLLLIILFATPYLFNFIRKIKVVQPALADKDKRKWFITASLVSFAVLLVWYIAYYPGASSIDGVLQYKQAISGNYDDWHPVLHTLLFVTLPLKLTGGWGGSIILWQIIWFSVAIGYISEICFEYCGKAFSILMTTLILINANTGVVAVWLWKDGPFAITSAVALIYAIRIYLSKDEWSNSLLNIIILAIMLCLTAILRHNGILLAAPLLLALAFIMKKKNYVKLAIIAVALFVLIKGPLYSALNVSQPGNRHTETMGLPMSIIGGCITESPDRLDPEIQEFAYAVVSKENWEEHFVSGSFNSVKHEYSNREVIENNPITTILGYTGKCFIEAPQDAIKASIDATRMVWAVGGEVGAAKSNNPVSSLEPFNTKRIGITLLQMPLKALIGTEGYTSLSLVFGYIGNTILVIIAFVCAFCDFKSWDDWKKIFICLPLLIYDFGTMLLLTGPDWRFFYVNYLVYPLLILLLISKNKTREKAE